MRTVFGHLTQIPLRVADSIRENGNFRNRRIKRKQRDNFHSYLDPTLD